MTELQKGKLKLLKKMHANLFKLVKVRQRKSGENRKSRKHLAQQRQKNAISLTPKWGESVADGW